MSEQPVSTPWQLPWPEGTVARYWTVAGATVDITRTSSTSEHHYYRCTGCHYGRDLGWVSEDIAHERAQAHSSVCRALPRPAVTK